MSTYLIDFENVKSSGLTGIDHIRKEDSVHLFWSKRENKITIEMMELIRKSESEIVMHKAVTGERDALDHQLCSYLGFLAGSQGETDFVIVSNDKAYDHLIEFWKRMNDSVRIRRVGEISRISETVKALEMSSKFSEALKNSEKSKALETAEVSEEAAVLETVPMEEADKAESTKAAEPEKEELFAENRSSRNSRRRERGGKYLKGGRTGRNNWKYAPLEQYTEEHTVGDMAGNAGEPQEKRAAEPMEAYSENHPVKTVSEDLERYVAEAVKEPVKNPVKKTNAESGASSVVVVTGIRTGILVESGFTADGILDHRSAGQETSKIQSREPAKEEKTDVIAEEKPALEETPASEEKSAITETKSDIAEEKPAVTETKFTIAKEKPVVSETKSTIAEEKPAVSEEKPAIASEAEKEVSENGMNEFAKILSEELAKLAADEAETVINETVQARADEEPENSLMQEAKEEKAAGTEKEETEKEKTEKEGTEKGEPEKKTRTRTAHTAGRPRRGRPPKKDRTEHVPEVKAPATVADVIAKCEDAANEDWAEEMVKLINTSRDKKELYAATVKLLGQEKGRTVYHKIKVLK